MPRQAPVRVREPRGEAVLRGRRASRSPSRRHRSSPPRPRDAAGRRRFSERGRLTESWPAKGLRSVHFKVCQPARSRSSAGRPGDRARVELDCWGGDEACLERGPGLALRRPARPAAGSSSTAGSGLQFPGQPLHAPCSLEVPRSLASSSSTCRGGNRTERSRQATVDVALRGGRGGCARHAARERGASASGSASER